MRYQVLKEEEKTKQPEGTQAGRGELEEPTSQNDIRLGETPQPSQYPDFRNVFSFGSTVQRMESSFIRLVNRDEYFLGISHIFA